jgi:thiamine kinase-like enzyme
LTRTPRLPVAWWNHLRQALHELADVPTSRRTIQQHYLDWAMPTFLGAPIDTTVPAWSTAHGDCHYANLCGPTLYLLDWEGWGLAPAGYDAAYLHAHSLLTPQTAGRVRAEFAHLLDTDTGRFAELAVTTELLHAITRGDLTDLTEPLHQRARTLLGRAIPSTPNQTAAGTPVILATGPL